MPHLETSEAMMAEWDVQKIGRKKHHKHLMKKWGLKKNPALNEIAEAIHEQVFQEVHCLDCAQCCTSIPPIVNQTDARRLAKFLGMKDSEVQENYLTIDEDGDQVMNASPCPFLAADNTCHVYEARPRACRQYPHTDKKAFVQNLGLHATNAQYCPAVFHIVQRMEDLLADG